MSDRLTCPRCERSVSVAPDRNGEPFVIPHDTKNGTICQESYATAPSPVVFPLVTEVSGTLRLIRTAERDSSVSREQVRAAMVEVRTDHPKPCCEDYCPLCNGGVA
jgi:hypothetical protein